MAVYEFNVKGQKVSKKGEHPELVNDSYNYLELQFSFEEDSEWENLTKRVLFRTKEEPVYCKQLNNENKVIVPWEVLTGGFFVFELYGITEDMRITTNYVTVYLKNSGYTEIVEEAIPATQSVLDDVYARLDGLDVTVGGHTGSISDLTGTVNDHSNMLSNHDRSISNLDNALDTAVSDLADLSTDYIGTKAMVLNHKVYIQSLQEEINNTIEMAVEYTDGRTETFDVVVK